VASVAPLSIQMLFENAIKHNVISKESPLEIKLYSEADFVIVENTLQPKNISLEDSKGMGLENIVNRYSFLSDKKVIVENDTHTFRVRIPVIRTDQHLQ
jgi:LytS/YehU family sensor histidine kinase